MPPAEPWARLTRAGSYLDALEREAEKRALGRGAGEVDVPPHRWPALARLLAKMVARGELSFGPLTPSEALVGGKRRTLYRAAFVDAAVLGVLAAALTEAAEAHLSPHLYSYRKGRSSLAAVRALCSYLHRHRRAVGDRRDRGLYVVQRDVRRYGESIAVDGRSELWTQLERVLADAEPAHRERARALIEAAVRAPIARAGGAARPLETGVPTGSPIQPALCNLYLTSVDRAVAGLDGVFYARFGDDLVAMHPEPRLAFEAAQAMEQGTRRLGLELKTPDAALRYFTLPGRPSEDLAAARPTSHLEYLGARIDFRGNLALAPGKARRLLQELRRRLRAASELLAAEPPLARLGALCAVANTALDPRSPVADPKAALLRFVADDRRQLRELDYLVALAVAEAASGRRGPRAFRRAGPRLLRGEYGLVSLVNARNSGARPSA